MPDNADLLRKLEDQLFQLARSWRKTRKPELVKEYHSVMEQMFQLGWNGHLDLACELPYELMPKIYFEE